MNMQSRPALAEIYSQQLKVWPEHERTMQASFKDRPEPVLDVSETLAAAILRLAQEAPDGLAEFCHDYRFMCEQIVMPEEIHFRRTGRYRLSSFEQANTECYANGPLMARYMNGLLLSAVLWDNHSRAFAHFATDFLPRLPAGSQHLEIGPGHGLNLFIAARSPQVGSITGWDISPTSIDKTRRALLRLDSSLQPKLVLQDLFDAQPGPEGEVFDSLTMSEVLEHLEDPVAALRSAIRFVKRHGLVFIHVPANSPAPDHIYLFNDLDHAVALVEEAGLQVIDRQAFPMSGATLARATKLKLAVSCVITARKP